MARTRATDYDDKRRAILDRSAELFAAHGYDRASMSRIAEACGVSKANLYHYYRDKDEILFDVIRLHLEELLEAVEAADRPGLPPEARLRGLAEALLEAYRDADAQHKVQINHLGLLAPERQAELKARASASWCASSPRRSPGWRPTSPARRSSSPSPCRSSAWSTGTISGFAPVPA